MVTWILPLSTSFIIPLPDRDLLVKRQSVLDLRGFTNRTLLPDIGFHVAQYGAFNKTKDSVLFVPGLEFSSLSLAQFIDDMRHEFNLLFLCAVDTTNVNNTTAKIEDIVNETSTYLNREGIQNITFVGESSGGILALGIAYQCQESRGVMVMNCATAYPQSPMHNYIKWGQNVTDIEYKIGVLIYLLTQPGDFNITDNNKLYLMLSMLINLFYFPKDVLLSRTDEWISKGIAYIKPLLEKYHIPVVTVASVKDELFDSKAEAGRLRDSIPNTTVVHVLGCGHLITNEKFPMSKVIKRYLLKRD